MALRHEQADDGWRALTRQLVATGRRRGASFEDAEDRAQEAMLRLVRDDQAAEPPPLKHAYRALQLANADALRRQTRKLEVPPNKRVSLHDADVAATISEPFGEPDEVERRLAFAQTLHEIQEAVGNDALEMSLKTAAGWSEAEIDAARRPGQPSTGALRKRVFRAIPELTDRLKGL